MRRVFLNALYGIVVAAGQIDIYEQATEWSVFTGFDRLIAEG